MVYRSPWFEQGSTFVEVLMLISLTAVSNANQLLLLVGLSHHVRSSTWQASFPSISVVVHNGLNALGVFSLSSSAFVCLYLTGSVVLWLWAVCAGLPHTCAIAALFLVH